MNFAQNLGMAKGKLIFQIENFQNDSSILWRFGTLPKNPTTCDLTLPLNRMKMIEKGKIWTKEWQKRLKKN